MFGDRRTHRRRIRPSVHDRCASADPTLAVLAQVVTVEEQGYAAEGRRCDSFLAATYLPATRPRAPSSRLHSPPQQIVDHRAGGLPKLRQPGIDIAALVVSPQGCHRDKDRRAIGAS